VISTPLGELLIGIHYVDYAAQKRTPKLSASFYRVVIAANGVASQEHLFRAAVQRSMFCSSSLTASAAAVIQCKSGRAFLASWCWPLAGRQVTESGWSILSELHR
jgi:hypothetical protein